MNHAASYGLWPLVVINSAVFIIFAFSFAKPQSAGDWRSTGPYARVRYPQYVGFVLPTLVWVYTRLARREEREALEDFGGVYARYAAVTPAFVSRLRSLRAA